MELSMLYINTFPDELRSFLCHFHSLWTALAARANMASPEFVYINLETWTKRGNKLNRSIKLTVLVKPNKFAITNVIFRNI